MCILLLPLPIMRHVRIYLPVDMAHAKQAILTNGCYNKYPSDIWDTKIAINHNLKDAASTSNICDLKTKGSP